MFGRINQKPSGSGVVLMDFELGIQFSTCRVTEVTYFLSELWEFTGMSFKDLSISCKRSVFLILNGMRCFLSFVYNYIAMMDISRIFIGRLNI